MNDNEKQIQDWQTKVRQVYGDQDSLLQYLFETMDNFYYRYLETSESKDLTTQQISSHTWGASSFEPNMGEAFKTSLKEVKSGITELAKNVPRDQKPMVRYSLWSEVKELSPEHGHLILISEINWDFSEFKDDLRKVTKKASLKYDDLAQFRKELALKLEEVCSLFN